MSASASSAPPVSTGTGSGTGIDVQSLIQFVVALSLVIERIIESLWVLLEKLGIATPAAPAAPAAAAAAAEDKPISDPHPKCKELREALSLLAGAVIGAALCYSAPTELFALSGIPNTKSGVNHSHTNAKLVIGVFAGFIAPYSHQFVKLGFDPKSGLVSLLRDSSLSAGLTTALTKAGEIYDVFTASRAGAGAGAGGGKTAPGDDAAARNSALRIATANLHTETAPADDADADAGAERGGGDIKSSNVSARATLRSAKKRL